MPLTFMEAQTKIVSGVWWGNRSGQTAETYKAHQVFQGEWINHDTFPTAHCTAVDLRNTVFYWDNLASEK